MKKSVMSADGSSAISGASRWLAACAESGDGALTTPTTSAQTPANATSAYAVLLAMPTSLPSGAQGRARVLGLSSADLVLVGVTSARDSQRGRIRFSRSGT